MGAKRDVRRLPLLSHLASGQLFKVNELDGPRLDERPLRVHQAVQQRVDARWGNQASVRHVEKNGGPPPCARP